MNVAQRILVVILGAALVGSTFAQEEPSGDDVLQRYQLAIDNLTAAVEAVPDDAVAARDELDRAFSALLTLSRGSSASLVESLDRVFARARTAIENESRTDLQVQARVLRGGFQRLLYESALRAAVEGDVDAARERLLRLVADVGIGEARAVQVREMEEVGPLRRVLEAGTAEQIAARLGALADAGAPGDVNVAYAQLARAYGDYLLVQDSPRLDPATNRRFIEAANALVDGETDAFLETVGGLADAFGQLTDAADRAIASGDAEVEESEAAAPDEVLGDEGAEADAAADEAAAVAAQPEAPEEAQEQAQEPAEPAEPAAEAGAEAGQAEAAPEAEADADAAQADAEAAEADAEAGPQEAPEDEAAQDEAEAAEAPALDVDPEVRAQVAAELEAERERDAVAALDGQLANVGVPADRRDGLVTALREAEVDDLEALQADLAAQASRLAAAAQRGERDLAEQLLQDLQTRYDRDLSPVVTEVAAGVDTDTRALLERLSVAPQLRVQETALLSSQLMAVSERLAAEPVPARHELVRAAAGTWAGWIRAAVMIGLAILALIPLRLLNLAFGGGNRNWRLVGTALFLLLVPVMFEGLAAAGALLVDPLGMPVLGVLTPWSVFQNDLAQMVWAALTLIALLAAIIGFYGICAQFGLIGRKRGRDTRTDATREGEATLVDWDEEF